MLQDKNYYSRVVVLRTLCVTGRTIYSHSEQGQGDSYAERETIVKDPEVN